MRIKDYATFVNESKQEDKLLRAVNAFVAKEVKHMDVKAEITSDFEDEEKGSEHLTVHIRYKHPAIEYKGKSKEEVTKNLKLIANNYKKVFALNFENFFETGWEGIKQIFSKKLRYNDVLSLASVVCTEYVSDDPKNYKSPGKYTIVRYDSDGSSTVLGEEQELKDKYKNDMYIIDVYVTIFTHII